MRPKLHYKDPAWDGDCWAVVCEEGGERVIESGLSAAEAMRRSTAINRQNARKGLTERVTVRFMGYPSTPSDQFGRE